MLFTPLTGVNKYDAGVVQTRLCRQWKFAVVALQNPNFTPVFSNRITYPQRLTLILMQVVENKQCLACGKTVRGRTDKKYCDDYCRNGYNNQLKRLTQEPLRAINKMLRRNRNILERVVSRATGRPVTILKEDLLLEGFYFKYITHALASPQGHMCYYCYDFGYTQLEEESVVIVQHP